MPYLVGIDVSTTAVKAVMIDLHGELVGSASTPLSLSTPLPGWSEQDPSDWWEATITSLRALLNRANITPEKIVSLGLTGQMHGAVSLDAKGDIIRPAILWNDARTATQCAEINDLVGADHLREITGNPALVGFQAPKILWLKEHEPENYAKVRHILLPKDYIRYRLSGELATDTSDAAGTLLLDLAKRAWSDEILSTLGIPRDWLPDIFEGPEVAGHVTSGAAQITGLAAGTPIVAGAGDNAAAAIGCGVVSEGTGLLSLGTSGVIFAPTDTLRIDPTGALHAFCHAVPEAYHLMGVILSAGGSLRWARDILSNVQSDTGDYGAFIEPAKRVAPGSEGLFFLPYLAGERTPHMDPAARGAWIGLSLAHRREHLVRAVLEGVAFALRDAWERMKMLGIAPPTLRIVGGGTKSAVWREIIAAVLDIPLQRLAIDKGAAFGAAILAGVGAGVYADVEESVARTVKLDDDLERPIPSLVEQYEGIYRKYASLYPALKASGVWKEG
ncbi:xylulokinase [Candidatus Bipolaricaulota bacterium]|nr:xylulokinase [Candidatus Bipolaricaulota bacterium]